MSVNPVSKHRAIIPIHTIGSPAISLKTGFPEICSWHGAIIWKIIARHAIIFQIMAPCNSGGELSYSATDPDDMRIPSTNYPVYVPQMAYSRSWVSLLLDLGMCLIPVLSRAVSLAGSPPCTNIQHGLLIYSWYVDVTYPTAMTVVIPARCAPIGDPGRPAHV